ncbi:MAG: hypothetical protein H6642_10225 [Caldilineaceae bacterium]|nr:hypothetical protein [Caldilineaceae bacterium]MCB9138712.1 hypothetical protein [Caldilineaceae bacterium]
MNSTTNRSGFSLHLMRDAMTAWRLLRDPRVPGVLKFGLPFLAFVYWVSPIDLLPGIVIDDIALVIAAMKMFIAMAPQDAVNRANGVDNAPNGEQKNDDDVVDTTWQVID